MIPLRFGGAWMLASGWLFLTGAPAAAQSCPCPKYDLPAIVRKADAIFIGKVLSATDDAAPNIDGGGPGAVEYQARVMVDVSTILKGNPPRFVELVTPKGPCQFTFAVGNTYLVTGSGRGATVTTDVCQANARGNAIDGRAESIRDVLHPED
jgi:hypothetical protein